MKIFVNPEDAERANEILSAAPGLHAEDGQGETPSLEMPETSSGHAPGERGGFLSLLRRWIKG